MIGWLRKSHTDTIWTGATIATINIYPENIGIKTMTESSSLIEGYEPHKSKSSSSLQLPTIQFDSAG